MPTVRLLERVFWWWVVGMGVGGGGVGREAVSSSEDVSPRRNSPPTSQEGRIEVCGWQTTHLPQRFSPF